LLLPDNAAMSESAPLGPLQRIRGTLTVPGDKSISHRSYLFGALAEGTSEVRGASRGEDVLRSRAVAEALGARVSDDGDVARIVGVGWGVSAGDDLDAPLELDCGNSGTTARLLMGLLAGRRGRFRLHGDDSLSRRPMGRVARPLAQLRATIAADGGGDAERLPLVVSGAELRAADLVTEVPSAQVKSALILAALQAEGTSAIREERLSRDHTERLLRSMGAPLEQVGPTAWSVTGGRAPLKPLDLTVPGDPSSAAYAVALACLLPDSELTVEGVSLNPTRTGVYALLQRMGADLVMTPEREEPEPIGRLVARSSSLKAIDVGPEDVVAAIDELPLLAVVAAAAEGTTTISGAGELRHKETDRLATTAALLREAGVDHEETDDGLIVRGPTAFRPGAFASQGDHRLAMCAAVAAALADGPSTLEGGEWVRISYPGFFADLERLSSGSKRAGG
jgi:3-phosphoshikimate 1-carboxyvinyltransferase